MSTTTRFSLGEYDQIVAAGVSRGTKPRRVELIRGKIRDMTPIGPMHEEVVDRLTDWSVLSVVERKGRTRIQHSIGISQLESAPQPDVVWVKQRDYSRARPTPEDVLLVIEVSESMLRVDTGEKADLYAEAGIRDFWVVNTPERCVEVRRESAGGSNRSLVCLAGDEGVRPLAFPEIVLVPPTLWP